VPVGAPVQYRNVTVGKIASEGQAPNGSVAVKFDFYPSRIVHVPKGVQAEVAPLSIFGNQYVNLVPPATIGAGHLAAGDFIDAYGGQPSTSLQGTTTQLYDLLNAIHPADLDTALTAFATALNGEGQKLGQALDAASQYTSKTIEPRLATIQADLQLLVPVSNHLAAATPDLLGLLANSEVTGATITSQASDLHTLLATGAQATGKLAEVLQKSETQLIDLMNESGPLLSDVTANPNELSLTLSGLSQWSSAWAAAETHGPFLSVTANLPVSDISSGVNAALGYDNPASIAAALGPSFNPATYSSANCPVYPGGTNPYCGRGGSPAASTQGISGSPVCARDVGLAAPSCNPAVLSAGSQRQAANAPAETKAAIDGVAALSAVFAQKQAEVETLVTQSDQLSSVLNSDTDQLVSLLGQADIVLQVLNQRKAAIDNLLSTTTGLTQRLDHLVVDDRSSLDPLLANLRTVSASLASDSANLGKAIPLLEAFARYSANVTGSGPFADVVAPGLVIPDNLVAQCASIGALDPQRGCRV
jgi:phospholipid/cholesterol/gamma-HCH transport system substrate-binding protein